MTFLASGGAYNNDIKKMFSVLLATWAHWPIPTFFAPFTGKRFDWLVIFSNDSLAIFMKIQNTKYINLFCRYGMLLYCITFIQRTLLCNKKYYYYSTVANAVPVLA